MTTSCKPDLVTEPVVSIIIVSYNTRQMTLDAIASVKTETNTSHEIIVIDNASEDGSAEAIAEAYSDITLMAEKENHGFALANNIASKQARGTFILLLNPDTVVLDHAIDKLLAFADTRPNACIWGGCTLYGDHSLNPTNCWDHMSVWSLFCQVSGLSTVFSSSVFFNPEAYGDWKRDSEREVGIVTGCFFLIRRHFWEELGGFDQMFVMYGEEADLCLRAIAKCARPMITPDAKIIHYVGAASTIPAHKRVMVLKAKATLIRRYFHGWRAPAGHALLISWALSRMLASRVLRRDNGWPEAWSRRKEWMNGYPGAGSEAQG
ncbi:MAG: glycosyltransferase family 2 protein [Pseudomonadota bacterium]